MNVVFGFCYFFAGGCSCWNFMRSAYVYPALTPSIYALDFTVAVIQFALAWLACRIISRVSA